MSDFVPPPPRGIPFAEEKGGGLVVTAQWFKWFNDLTRFVNITGGTAGGIPSTRKINTTAPLAGGGVLDHDLTLSVSGVIGGSGGPTVVLPPEEEESGGLVVPGPQGPAGSPGSAGAAGAPGPAVYLEAEPAEDTVLIPGPAGSNGVAGVAGPSGPAVYLEAEPGEDGLTIVGPAGPQGPAGGGGGGTWTEIEVDFGTTPVADKLFSVSDGTVSSTSKVIIMESGKAATGRIAGDAEWDSITAAALPATGSFTIYALARPGPVVGKRKLHYTVA